jgi:phosphopantothenoylcysteine synthetase/decarboxylase
MNQDSSSKKQLFLIHNSKFLYGTLLADMDTKKTIILGVTGSVAAIKIPDLISLLKEYPYNIKIVATDAGMHFIDVRQLEKLTGNSVYHELFVRNDLSQKKSR